MLPLRQKFTQVNIFNAADLDLFFGCSSTVYNLVNVTGVVYPANHGDSKCSELSTFVIVNSTLDHYHSSTPTRVEIEFSYIKVLSISASLNLQLKDTVIDTCRNVTLQGDTQVWDKVKINDLQDSVVATSLFIKSTEIKVTILRPNIS